MKSFLKSQTKHAVTTFVICFSIALSIFIIFVLLASLPDNSLPNYKTTFGDAISKNKFLAIPITGTIVGSSDEIDANFLNSLGNTPGYDVQSELIDAAKDNSIKGIILEINSPGGELSGAHAIAEGVSRYKAQTKNPVIASISGLGTSGAYWAAISADYVFADYGSEIGDIGVISGPFAYFDKVVAQDGGVFGSGVVTQNGISQTYIYAGQSKDLGNPYRQLTTDEVTVLQQAVNDEYTGFVKYVSERRHIPTDTIRTTIKALPFGNTQALSYHLIDGIKGRQDTYSFLAKKLGITDDDFQVVRLRQSHSLISSLLQGTSKVAAPKANAFCNTVGILSYFGNVENLCK